VWLLAERQGEVGGDEGGRERETHTVLRHKKSFIPDMHQLEIDKGEGVFLNDLGGRRS